MPEGAYAIGCGLRLASRRQRRYRPHHVRQPQPPRRRSQRTAQTTLRQPLFFDTVIPRNIRLAEAPSHGLPAFVYDAHAKGTQAYLDLADELIARLEK